MSDIILGEGREVNIDLGAFTLEEYESLFDKKGTTDKEVIAKASGLTVQEISKLSMKDWKRLVRAVIDKVKSPLSDPN
jgi:hypothetical protein